MAHKEHGKLGWEKLFDEGIQLATNGYRIPGRMGDAIKGNAASLALDANAVSAFFNTDGTPKATGTVTTNLPYAQTLRTLASGGANAMYSGPLAEAIVAKAAQAVGDDAAKTPITPSPVSYTHLTLPTIYSV